jgi:hypothetical protein
MKARQSNGPGTAIEFSTQAVAMMRECQVLFQKLRPQIERVAPGQKRRRMPAEAYALWDRLGTLDVLILNVHAIIRDEPHTCPAAQPPIRDIAREGNVISLAAATAKLHDFKSGNLAYHHCHQARLACMHGPIDDQQRGLIDFAIRELRRYGRALSKSPEMVELARSKWPDWPDWYLDKIFELQQLRKHKESGAAAAPKPTAPKPSWNGQGIVIQYSPRPGPYAGGE